MMALLKEKKRTFKSGNEEELRAAQDDGKPAMSVESGGD